MCCSSVEEYENKIKVTGPVYDAPTCRLDLSSKFGRAGDLPNVITHAKCEINWCQILWLEIVLRCEVYLGYLIVLCIDYVRDRSILRPQFYVFILPWCIAILDECSAVDAEPKARVVFEHCHLIWHKLTIGWHRFCAYEATTWHSAHRFAARIFTIAKLIFENSSLRVEVHR